MLVSVLEVLVQRKTDPRPHLCPVSAAPMPTTRMRCWTVAQQMCTGMCFLGLGRILSPPFLEGKLRPHQSLTSHRSSISQGDSGRDIPPASINKPPVILTQTPVFRVHDHMSWLEQYHHAKLQMQKSYETYERLRSE